jgi:hypothetical protein
MDCPSMPPSEAKPKEKAVLTVKNDRNEQDDEGLSARDTERHAYQPREVSCDRIREEGTQGAHR